VGQRDLDPIPDPAGTRPQPGGRRMPASAGFRDDAHAVVIGINRYVDPRIPDLRYATADAKAFHDVLTDPALGRFRPENVTLLLDDDATERRIRSAIGTELPRRASADHTVCIFFAGHGAPVMNARTRSSDGLEKYLLPHDALADDLRSSAIPMDDVQKFFDWIDTSQVIFFIDSCYSGVAGGRTFGSSDYGMRATVTDEFLDQLGGEGRLVVTACATNEVALEKAELGHGLFTYYLIEGLKGGADAGQDGLVTLDELYEYVYRNVERQARELGGSMSPLRKGFVKGSVYLTQYVTPTVLRVREATAAANAAVAGDDLDGADRLWREVLQHDPDNASARQGVIAIAERRARQEAERERNEAIRLEALRARQRVLLEHRVSGALSLPLYNQAMDLLEKDTASLRTADRVRREDTDALIDGTMTAEQYVRSMELLAAAPPRTGMFRALAPPAPAAPADPPREPRSHSSGQVADVRTGRSSSSESGTPAHEIDPSAAATTRTQHGAAPLAGTPSAPGPSMHAAKPAAGTPVREAGAAGGRPDATNAAGQPTRLRRWIGQLLSALLTFAAFVFSYILVVMTARSASDAVLRGMSFVMAAGFAIYARRLVRRERWLALVLAIMAGLFWLSVVVGIIE